MPEQVDPALKVEDIEEAYEAVDDEADRIIQDMRSHLGRGPTIPAKLSDLGLKDLGDLMNKCVEWLDTVRQQVLWAEGEYRTKKAVLEAAEGSIWAESLKHFTKSDKESRRAWKLTHFRYVKHNKDVLIWRKVAETLEQDYKAWHLKVRTLSRVGGFELEGTGYQRRRENLGSRRMPTTPPAVHRKS